MPKIKPMMDLVKFKKALRELKAEGPELPFRAIKGIKKGETEPLGGLYIGQLMAREYEADRKAVGSLQIFRGTIRRSGKDPARRFVLEVAGAPNILREIGRVSLRAAQLPYQFVIAKPGTAEPEPLPEDDSEQTPFERLTKILPEYKKAFALATVYKAKLKALYDEVVELIKKEDDDEAHAVLDTLAELIPVALAAPRGAEQTAPQKAALQTARHQQLAGTLEQVKKSYLTSGTADRYAADKSLKSGKEFTAFITALRRFEGTRNLKNLELVKAAAELYLKHYHQDLWDWQKTNKESLSKKAICEMTLKALSHWRIALEYDALG